MMPLIKTLWIGQAAQDRPKPVERMPKGAEPQRRKIIAGLMAVSAASLGALLAPSPAIAASRIITPRQSLGPFYPREWKGDIDADLVRVRGAAADAMGQVTHISGRITDTQGVPLSGAQVEIWQCDARGRYLHPGDRGRGRGVQRDNNFQGRGRVITGKDGRYSFRTIRPVAYPGRTPHIHFAIRAPGGRQLVTQMYVAGEPLNDRDFLLQRLRDSRQRAQLLVSLEPGDRIEPGALVGEFDIVMG